MSKQATVIEKMKKVLQQQDQLALQEQYLLDEDAWDEDYHHVDVQMWLNDLWRKKDQLNLEYHKLLKKLMKLEGVS